ncbi:MAG: AraC family transcriptional regulator ligand-binding domain-containing protein [Pseudomonadota bacterium]
MVTSVRLAIGLLPLVQALDAAGEPVDAILEDAGIPRFALDEPSYRITFEQELTFTRMALAHLKMPDLGLEIGRKYHISMLGTLGLAASTAPTAVDVFHTALAFPLRTWSVFHISTWRDQHHGFLVMAPDHDLQGSEDYFTVRDVACAVTLLRDVIGKDASPNLVQFALPKPASLAPYEQFFACEVRFEQEQNETRYPLAIWREPLPQANGMLHRFFASQCRDLSNAMSHPLSYADIVSGRLRSATPIPTLREIAEDLHLAERTLQRRLADEGVGFSDLLREVRRERAEDYLCRTRMPMDEIAERLGYADAVAFSRAFKGWTGQSPRAFRSASAGMALV